MSEKQKSMCADSPAASGSTELPVVYKPNLANLPTEVKLAILSHLPSTALAKTCGVNREFASVIRAHSRTFARKIKYREWIRLHRTIDSCTDFTGLDFFSALKKFHAGLRLSCATWLYPRDVSLLWLFADLWVLHSIDRREARGLQPPRVERYPDIVSIMDVTNASIIVDLAGIVLQIDSEVRNWISGVPGGMPGHYVDSVITQFSRDLHRHWKFALTELPDICRAATRADLLPAPSADGLFVGLPEPFVGRRIHCAADLQGACAARAERELQGHGGGERPHRSLAHVLETYCLHIAEPPLRWNALKNPSLSALHEAHCAEQTVVYLAASSNPRQGYIIG